MARRRTTEPATYPGLGDAGRGLGIVTGGHHVFLYGPADGSAPLIGDAGTYHITQDTAAATITYSTDPQRIGLNYRWTVKAWSGDTGAYVVLNDSGQVIGRGRGVRRR